MIKIEIEYINKSDGEKIAQPKRDLTDEEKLTITSVSCDGVNYIYYQGDETKI